MTEGTRLSPADSDCVEAVCAADSYCCGTAWDKLCVQGAAKTCYARYLTRPRVEEQRMMVDSCIEPHLAGAADCPIKTSGTANRECCRRALALNGVYTAIPDTGGYGRQVKWSNFGFIETPDGLGYVSSTLIPDPCVTRPDGTRSCTDPHHLWQAAGPGSPYYPDCSGAGGPLPCNNATYANQHVDWADGYSAKPMRGAMVALQSSLITTDGHFQVDLRWTFGGPNNTLGTDPDFDAASVEAIWNWDFTQSFFGIQTYQARPVCYGGNPETPGPARAVGDLVANIPYCGETYFQNSPDYQSVQTMYYP
jgi:hypothetical protein